MTTTFLSDGRLIDFYYLNWGSYYNWTLDILEIRF